MSPRPLLLDELGRACFDIEGLIELFALLLEALGPPFLVLLVVP